MCLGIAEVAKKCFSSPGMTKKCFGAAEVEKSSVLMLRRWQKQCFDIAGAAEIVVLHCGDCKNTLDSAYMFFVYKVFLVLRSLFTWSQTKCIQQIILKNNAMNEVANKATSNLFHKHQSLLLPLVTASYTSVRIYYSYRSDIHQTTDSTQ